MTGHNPVGVATCFNLVSQGGSFRATLGFEPESLWDSEFADQNIRAVTWPEENRVSILILFHSSHFTPRIPVLA